MLMSPSFVCGVTRSILGQPWRWRGAEAEGDTGFRPDALIDQLLLARGVARDDLERHRQPTLRGFMPDPSVFRDMDKAAARLADAVEAGEAVTIFGDYDVDGATSAALLIRLLRQLGGAPQAYIPDRLMEGYGPSGEALVRIAAGGARLIVTVDCGAQAFEALAMARAAGVDVIVVDHHKCASRLPDGFAIVNPNRLDESDEGAVHGHLAAVGVAFLLGAALLRTLRGRGFFAGREEPKLIELLDLVALGTVADVAQLKGLNRAFVTQGLKVMAQRRNIGLAALADAARLNRAPTCDRPRLRARTADQRRRPGRQVGPRRAPAHHRGSGRGQGDRGRARPAQRGTAGDRGDCVRGGRGAGRDPGQPRRRRRRGAGLAPRRDRHRRRPPQGEIAQARHRRRARRRRHRQGLGPLDLRRRSRRRGARGEGRTACSSPAAAMRWRRA